jgi:hypothetical protein
MTTKVLSKERETMARQKIAGPYKAVPVGEQWKVVRVIGRHPSLEAIEQRRLEIQQAHQRELEQHPHRPLRPLRDEAYWERQRAQAGQEIVRDVDGGKLYSHRQAAYRRSVTLNRQWQNQQLSEDRKETFTMTQQQQQQTFHLEYPPFSCDPINILTDEEFWQELPANHHYETVTVPGDFRSVEELEAWVARENEQRR